MKEGGQSDRTKKRIGKVAETGQSEGEVDADSWT